MHRILVFTLVVTLSSIGIPLLAHAATGEESPPLTFNGRPLSELLHGRATGAPFPLPALLQQGDGQISGVLLDQGGQPLADRRVELSRPRSEGEGRLVETTDADGAFSYTGLGPGRYEVLYRVDDEVRARSGPIDLAASAMQVSGVSVAVPPRNPDRIATGVARSFEELVRLVFPDDTVSIIDTTGTEVSGRIERVSDSTLALLTDDGPREWSEVDVRIIRQRQGDSVKNGALIGAGLGIFGVGTCLAIGAPVECVWGGLVGTGLYAAIGAGIDALIRTRHVIYDSAGSADVSLSPLVTRSRRGALVSLSF